MTHERCNICLGTDSPIVMHELRADPRDPTGPRTQSLAMCSACVNEDPLMRAIRERFENQEPFEAHAPCEQCYYPVLQDGSCSKFGHVQSWKRPPL